MTSTSGLVQIQQNYGAEAVGRHLLQAGYLGAILYTDEPTTRDVLLGEMHQLMLVDDAYVSDGEDRRPSPSDRFQALDWLVAQGHLIQEGIAGRYHKDREKAIPETRTYRLPPKE